MATPFLPDAFVALVDKLGVVSNQLWRKWFEDTTSQLTTVQRVLNSTIGVNVITIATQPTLGTADAGYIARVDPYYHLVRWTGSVWDWADGDRPGKIEDYALDPGSGYQLCNGTSTDRLVVGGATLTTTAFTTPNLTATLAYRKSAAAYTGTINAASGSTGTGTTGTGTTGTGTTGTGTSGSATDTFTSGTPSVNNNIMAAGGNSVPAIAHTHSGTTDGHSHSVPGLSVPGLSVPGLSMPALSVGTIDMPNLGMLPYYRR